jgi:hypothetical protein
LGDSEDENSKNSEDENLRDYSDDEELPAGCPPKNNDI